jgi:hypothetical protein
MLQKQGPIFPDQRSRFPGAGARYRITILCQIFNKMIGLYRCSENESALI